MVVPTHPAGVIVATEPLSPSPWGVAISSQGLAFVTQPAMGAPALKRITLPAVTLTEGPMGSSWVDAPLRCHSFLLSR